MPGRYWANNQLVCHVSVSRSREVNGPLECMHAIAVGKWIRQAVIGVCHVSIWTLYTSIQVNLDPLYKHQCTYSLVADTHSSGLVTETKPSETDRNDPQV